MKKIYCLMVGMIGLLGIGCVPPTDKEITEVRLDYSNPELQKLYNYVDRQEMDSLLPYAAHPDPAFRYQVANAFAAIKTTEGLDTLSKLLYDPVLRVRKAAAYGAGQTGSTQAVSLLLEGFMDKDTMNVNNSINSAILESIGKTASENLLRSLATVTTYRKTDTLLLLGQTRGIYRFALRGITLPEGTDLMVQYLTDPTYPENIRLMAAHYLQRARNITIEDYKFRIAEVFSQEDDPYIKMALALALGKTNDPEILQVLLTELEAATDYRLKVNILKSLSPFPYIRAVEPALKYINDQDVRVAVTAANYLMQNGNSSDATIYRSFIQDSMHWQVKSRLYAAVLNHLPYYYARTKAILKNEITQLLEASDNAYEKAAYLDAMAYDPSNYQDMKTIGFDSEPVLKTTAVNGLGRMLRNPQFVQIFRNGTNRVKLEIMNMLKEALSSGDAGMVAVAGGIFKDSQIDWTGLVDDVTFLEEAMVNLELPKEIEAYNEIKAAIARFTGNPYVPHVLEYNHPIDWDFLSTISDTSQVVIRTTKGNIRVELMKNDAPGTVANFMQLVNDGFYNQKVFHRVVPNFVIQTGCPRGDGYGSLDYTIRSELPQLYYDGEGYMGMASAGNHTEGTQWFITHSPTPHLDGNYTIFAKVTEGMEVVHSIQQGDLIQDIIISRK